MVKELKIEPITRVEGHGGLRIVMGKDGKVKDAQFNIPTARFFEKLCEGRNIEHIPRITSRICGMCPIPHNLTPTKAIEDLWNVEIPTPALKLRKLLMNAKQYSSHLLSFYALSAPDFLVGPFADPASRNIIHLINKMPEIGKMAFKMMDFGQKLCAEIGGKSVHSTSPIIGGMMKPMDVNTCDKFLKQVEEQIEFTKKTSELVLKIVEDYWDVIDKIAVIPTYYLGMTKNGVHDIYEGDIRIMTPDGEKKDYDAHKYLDIFGEHIVNHSYASHLYYKPAGYPDGIYRAGSLGMINAADKMATPLADDALKVFREKFGPISHNTFAYHWARLVETIEAIELIKQLLEDPDICNPECKNPNVNPREGEGIAITEAPSGLLLYHIWSDEEGFCKKLNLIVSTNHNIAGIEKSILYTAKQVLDEKILDSIKLPEPVIK